MDELVPTSLRELDEGVAYKCGLDGWISGGVLLRGKSASFCRIDAVSIKPTKRNTI